MKIVPWQRRYFKDAKQKVWVEVDDSGEPKADAKGLIPMRYKVEDASRTYTASRKHIGAPTDPSASLCEAPQGAQRAKPAAPLEALSPSEDEAMRHPGELLIAEHPPASLRSQGDLTPDTIEIYTDGACQGNPGPCSLGAVIRYGSHYKEMSQYLGLGTNNIGELTAILVALKSLSRFDLPVRLHTDSSYAIGVITKGWKAKANTSLILTLRELAGRFEDLRFIKVKGHAGVPLNERADELAVGAIERQRRLKTA